MALSEFAVYALGLGIVLSIVWLFPSLHFEKFWTRVDLLSHSRTDQSFGFSDATEKVAESRFPTSWWADENSYQLECRAIFSKVCFS